LTVSCLACDRYCQHCQSHAGLLTDAMEQNPVWDADISLPSQELPRILWNPKFHCCVHITPSLVSLLNQTSSVQALPSSYENTKSSIWLKCGCPCSVNNQSRSSAVWKTSPALPAVRTTSPAVLQCERPVPQSCSVKDQSRCPCSANNQSRCPCSANNQSRCPCSVKDQSRCPHVPLVTDKVLNNTKYVHTQIIFAVKEISVTYPI